MRRTCSPTSHTTCPQDRLSSTLLLPLPLRKAGARVERSAWSATLWTCLLQSVLLTAWGQRGAIASATRELYLGDRE
jgi:hypothetical protein